MAEPEKVINQGNCSAAVFANEITVEEKTEVIKKVTVQKRYMDKDGNWQSTNSYGVNDLPKLVLVAVKAYDYLTSKKHE